MLFALELVLVDASRDDWQGERLSVMPQAVLAVQDVNPDLNRARFDIDWTAPVPPTCRVYVSGEDWLVLGSRAQVLEGLAQVLAALMRSRQGPGLVVPR